MRRINNIKYNKNILVSIVLLMMGIGFFVYPKLVNIKNDITQKKVLLLTKQNIEQINTIQANKQSIQNSNKVQNDVISKSQQINGQIVAEQEKMEKITINNQLNIKSETIISISKINLELPVIEDFSTENLDIAPCFLENSVKIGETGNCVISGHRSRNFGRHFNRLGELRKGEMIELRNPDKTVEYKVSEILIVEPKEIWVTEQTEKPMLTLITCHPIEEATHRLIIRAKLIENDEV